MMITVLRFRRSASGRLAEREDQLRCVAGRAAPRHPDRYGPDHQLPLVLLTSWQR